MPRSLLLAVLALLVLPIGCGGGGGSDALPVAVPPVAVPPDAAHDPLPLLPSGTHLGVIYVDAGGDEERVLDAAFGRCLTAGCDAYELSVPWDLLEPTPGTFDVSVLTQWLDTLRTLHLLPYLVVPTIDTNTLRLPDDLVDPEDSRALADGRAFDDPVILERFERLLDAIVPILVARGGFYLSVGNEVDIYLGAYGGGDAFARFTEAARRHVRTLAPGLAVGATLTYAGLQRRRPLFDTLLEASDVLSLTYYPLDEAMQVRDPSVVADDLDAILEAAGDRPVLLQEVGYPAGDEVASDLGSSDALQRRFVVDFFQALASRPRIRFASWFALDDLTAAAVEGYLDYYGIHLERFREFLATLGLHHADGTARSGFAAFLVGVAAQTGR